MAGPEQRHDLRENLPVNHAQRDALLCHANLTRGDSAAAVDDPDDRADIHNRYAAVVQTIERGEHVQAH